MNTQKAIQVIDTVSDGINNKRINISFIEKELYGKVGMELYKHVLDKFNSKKDDFFDFYLSASDDVKRYILEGIGIEVERDKYPDYDTRITQLIGGTPRFEVYPFEEEILYQYFLFGYNNSLEVLQEVSPLAWKTVLDNNIKPFGCCKNWTEFWSKANKKDKELLIKYITENK
jgi:hypothetical protein